MKDLLQKAATPPLAAKSRAGRRGWIAALLVVLTLGAMLLGGCDKKPKVDPGNLLTNPSFEAGWGDAFVDGQLPEGWSYSNYTHDYEPGPSTRKVTGYQGGSAVRLVGADPESVANKDPFVGDDMRIYQKVEVKPYGIYKLSGWIRVHTAPGTAGRGGWLSILNTNSGTPEVLDTQESWQYVECYLQAEKGQRYVEVACRLGGWSATSWGWAEFDQISFEQVEAAVGEPQSMADLTQKDNKPAVDDKGNPMGRESFQDVMVVLDVLFIFACVGFGWLKRRRAQWPAWWVWVGLGLLLVVRLWMAAQNTGYQVDMNLWRYWGETMLANGPAKFYQAVSFCDYPPLYPTILALLAGLAKLFNASASSGLSLIIFRLPAILADLGIAYIIFRMARRKMGDTLATLIALLFALNPLAWFNSAVWGQVDSLFFLLMLLCFIFLGRKKHWAAGVMFGLAMMCKFQAIIFLPALAWPVLGMFMPAKKGERADTNAAWMALLQTIGMAIATIAIIYLPASIAAKDPILAYRHFSGTISYYGQFALNPLNLLALMGQNWKPMAEATGFMAQYAKFGAYLAVALATGGVTAYYFYNRAKGLAYDIYAAAALVLSTFFMFGPTMHERYILPAIFCLFVSFARTRDKRMLWVGGLWSAAVAASLVMILRDTWILPTHSGSYTLYMVLCAVSLFCWLGLVVTMFTPSKPYIMACEEPGADDAATRTTAWRGGAAAGAASAAQGQDAAEQPTPTLHRSPERATARVLARLAPPKKITWCRWDVLLMLGVTLAYSVAGFWNLGDMNAAQNKYVPPMRGETVEITFDDCYMLKNLWTFMELPYKGSDGTKKPGKMYVQISGDGVHYEKLNFGSDKTDANGSYIGLNNYGEVWQWKSHSLSVSGGKMPVQYVRLQFTGYLNLLEIGFADVNGTKIPIRDIKSLDDTSGQTNAGALVDEQEYFYGGDSGDYMHSTYFDEIYHPRTAYEMLHHQEMRENKAQIYETTHPQLGKVIMEIGIAIFGMTPFGWRFMGVVVGILMLPLMYAFGKVLFGGKKRWALLSMLFMALDGMHLVQTRLATIDSYSVFFIIIMYLLMYLFVRNAQIGTKWWKSCLPLALGGIAFGLGAASKWTCIYAGAGLAIIFFYTCIRRLIDAAVCRRLVAQGNTDPAVAQAATGTTRRVIAYVGIAFAFFVVIAAGIYFASYYQVLRIEYDSLGAILRDLPAALKRVWSGADYSQKSMLGYHSGENSHHAYSSQWFLWPIMFRPIWYFGGTGVGGTVKNIAGFGNPIIWFSALAAAIYGAVRWVRGFVHDTLGEAEKGLGFLLLAAFTQLAPWLAVSRSTFIYHYFPTLTFLLLLLTYACVKIHEKEPELFRWGIWVFMGAIVAVSAFFFPAWTGTAIPMWYLKIMKWQPGWFFGSGMKHYKEWFEFLNTKPPV